VSMAVISGNALIVMDQQCVRSMVAARVAADIVKKAPFFADIKETGRDAESVQECHCVITE
jgi:hypothetical protein